MPTEFDKWRDQKIIEIADEVAEIRERSMDIRQIVEDTLVAPMRAVAAARQMTVDQERAATEAAIADMRNVAKACQILHMGPGDVELVLKRLDYLKMLADAYTRVSSEHETMVSDLIKLLDNDDLDGARDLVKAEYDAIHGPRD